MNSYDARADLELIEVPTLVVAGGRDRLVDPGDAPAMAARPRRGHRMLLPGAGHALILEEHDALNTVVRRFLCRRLPRHTGVAAR